MSSSGSLVTHMVFDIQQDGTDSWFYHDAILLSILSIK
uniref:Uncharacterized protein n=1 Tax=Physcomitrium patens TaxID=3218 RepID=A0A2K1KKW6_PHYPA|nr:hypothetical protein PHYPA_008092 [Physcomitrium patens]